MHTYAKKCADKFPTAYENLIVFNIYKYVLSLYVVFTHLSYYLILTVPVIQEKTTIKSRRTTLAWRLLNTSINYIKKLFYWLKTVHSESWVLARTANRRRRASRRRSVAGRSLTDVILNGHGRRTWCAVEHKDCKLFRTQDDVIRKDLDSIIILLLGTTRRLL